MNGYMEWMDRWMAGDDDDDDDDDDDAVCVTLSPSYIQLAHALEVLVHGLYEGVDELYVLFIKVK